MALGYEDLNDHDQLRSGPSLTATCGKRERHGEQLAPSATLGRIENAAPGLALDDRYRRVLLDYKSVNKLLLDLLLEANDEPPEEVILDLDATDARIHGKQQGRFSNGYYDSYCDLPLYTFAGDHILGARLRRSNEDGAAGSVEELERIVTGLQDAWPQVRIVVPADSGFCREWLMIWREARNSVDRVSMCTSLQRTRLGSTRSSDSSRR